MENHLHNKYSLPIFIVQLSFISIKNNVLLYRAFIAIAMDFFFPVHSSSSTDTEEIRPSTKVIKSSDLFPLSKINSLKSKFQSQKTSKLLKIPSELFSDCLDLNKVTLGTICWRSG